MHLLMQRSPVSEVTTLYRPGPTNAASINITNLFISVYQLVVVCCVKALCSATNWSSVSSSGLAVSKRPIDVNAAWVVAGLWRCCSDFRSILRFPLNAELTNVKKDLVDETRGYSDSCFRANETTPACLVEGKNCRVLL